MYVLIIYFGFLSQNFAEADNSDKACFCGGMGRFYEMVASVEALLCPEDQLLFGSGSKALEDEAPSEVLGMQEEDNDEAEEEVDSPKPKVLGMYVLLADDEVPG